MKGFLKKSTIGAALGLAMIVGGIGQAHAILLGETIRTTIEFPTMGSVVVGPDDRVVDGSVELTNYGGVARINFMDTQIRILSVTDDTFLSAPFNGLHFLDLNGTIDPWVVSINNPGTTVSGVGLTFDDDNIFVNLANLSVENGDTILLDVVQPIPEPSTILLLGTGLAGVIGWRYRKVKA